MKQVSSLKQRFASATEQHCRRVSAWALELAKSWNISESNQIILAEAAMHHHNWTEMSPRGLRRLAHDLRIETSRGLAEISSSFEEPREASASETVSRCAHEVLDAFHNLGGSPSAQRLAEILDISNIFDESLEYEYFRNVIRDDDPYGDEICAQIQSRLALVPAVDFGTVKQSLPVFPTVARQALRAAQNPNIHIEDLAGIVRSDQVLAGRIIDAANTAMIGPRERIKGLRHAIIHIGTLAAMRVLVAASIRDLFVSQSLRQIWNHSLVSAETASNIALLTAPEAKEEAFLAGLVCDIGRLLISFAPVYAFIRLERLLQNECPPALAEKALFRQDHAQLGAELLKEWQFHDSISEAVLWHHAPERTASKLASILYLTEQVTGSCEDLPSFARFYYACQALGISSEQLSQVNASVSAPLSVLAFAI